MTRTVSLILVDEEGSLQGALPAFPVDVPYWQEVSDVVAGAKTRHGVDVAVLRLLSSANSEPHGGDVTYLAELIGGLPPTTPPLEPVESRLRDLVTAEEPLRLPYARPGGPSESLAWARKRLAGDYDAAQQRTWNLSAIWRLNRRASGDAQAGQLPATVWLKQVPPFFGHEAAVLDWATRQVPASTPPLLGAGPERRLLLGHVEGEDLYDAGVSERLKIVDVAHRIQRTSMACIGELAAAGVPDRRGVAMGHWIRAELCEHTDHIGAHPAAERLADLLAGLDDRLQLASACGLPDALVHGDEHPGNAIGRSAGDASEDDGIVLLDWGDSYLGHPAFDALRLGVGLPPAEAEEVVTAWVGTWREEFADCDPRKAVELVRPVEPLRLAAVYASFLRQIEPTERRYHAADVASCLDRALDLAVS